MDIFTLDIPQSRSWSDDDLFEFCAANKELKIERDEHGYIIVMSPPGGFSSHYIFVILLELGNWNRKSHKGMIFESSGGFLLREGSMRAPDVSFVIQGKWDVLTDKEKRQFPPVCPDFVVEVRSESDRLAVLQNKMQAWIRNGSKLAWLIDPSEKKVHIYRPESEVEIISSFEAELSGEDILPNFSFDLRLLLTA